MVKGVAKTSKSVTEVFSESNNLDAEKIWENDIVKFWFEEGILHSQFKARIDISIDTIKELIALRHTISDKKKQYWCYDLTHIQFFSKEAMHYTEIHGQDYLHATAAVVKSHVAKFIFNWFSKFKEAKIPLQAFTCKEKAVTWLKELRKETG